MDFEKLVGTHFIEEESPKFVYPSTYDPFKVEFCGNLNLADTIMKQINKDFIYQKYVKPYFKIKKVIFNNPATIVYWEDGTKTVVKCGKDDTFDKEKGLALCFMKKALGNKGNYNNVLKEHTK